MGKLEINISPHVLKWVSLLCAENKFTLQKFNLYINGLRHLGQNTSRLYGTESYTDSKNGLNFGRNGRKARAVRAQAQSALVDYFHLTRSFRYMDAENMSKNAPEFLNRLMQRVDIDTDDENIKHSVSRFLRYEPVNEFEPFFESIGLNQTEYAQFIPRDLMFLADDELLLENYYVLCDYGIERNRIGKIFKEANEVFQYDYGALRSKLLSFESLGLRQSLVAKIVASSPHLLRGNAGESVQFLEKLKEVEIEYDWLSEHIGVVHSCNWKCMLHVMCLLCKFGLSEKQVGEIFKQNPNLLLECSGRITLGLIGILLKYGSTTSEVRAFFLQFPRIPVWKFTYNLHNAYTFLVGIDMDDQDIGWIVRSCPVLLGSIELKKVSSMMNLMSCGKTRLREMVKDDPFTLERWALGRKVERLSTQERTVNDGALKHKFLISLGFEESSKDMEMARVAVRGKGEELQERFDCLVKNGLSREQVIKMVKRSPQVLNQTSRVLETKIRILFDDLGYRVPELVNHPKIIAYTTKRMKLRLLMYKWLQDEGALNANVSVGTLLARSDQIFIRTFVNPHAGGPEFWKSLNETLI